MQRAVLIFLGESVKLLRKHARGDRIGYIGSNNLSGNKNRQYTEKILGRKFSMELLEQATFVEQ